MNWLRHILQSYKSRCKDTNTSSARTPLQSQADSRNIKYPEQSGAGARQSFMFRMNRLDGLHRRSDIDKHLDLLFSGMSLVGREFSDVYRTGCNKTGTSVGAWKTIKRADRIWNLTKYFQRSFSAEGARVECGVFRGLSALICAEVMEYEFPGWNGEGMYLVDSYEGLSPTVSEDGAEARKLSSLEDNTFAVSLEEIKKPFESWPLLIWHKGWIPQALSDLPDTKWAFVHLDVDLYEPTKDCLEYFLPRLSEGGIIVNDDYESELFPGCGLAWDEVMDRYGLPFVSLPSGQSVYIK